MASKNEFSIPQSWKRKSVLIAIHTRHDNSSIAKFLKVDKSWVWRTRKELEESEGDYEAKAERSTHKQRSEKNKNQINRWLAICPKYVFKVMQTKFPATVMVFKVIS